MFSNPVVKPIANKHNKSITQIILRWLIQRDIAVIHKSAHKECMIENLSIFDFVLDSNDMETMAGLDTKNPYFSGIMIQERINWITQVIKSL